MLDPPKSKKRESSMTMKKIITGGAPFAAHKEMKAKANHFSLPKRALQVNHNRQEQTYKSKLQSTRMIIKKIMMMMTAKWNSSLELENTKKIFFSTFFIEKNKEL